MIDEKWLEMLSDESRAEVMKVQITECEKTKRNNSDSRREVLTNEGNQLALFGIVLLFGIMFGINTCSSYYKTDLIMQTEKSKNEVQKKQLELNHPASCNDYILTFKTKRIIKRRFGAFLLCKTCWHECC